MRALIRACLALLVLGPGIVLAAAPVAAQPGFTISTSQSSPVTGVVTLTANLQAEPGLSGVQFALDGYPLEAFDATFPYEIQWSAASATNGRHTIAAEARYASGAASQSDPLVITVENPPTFNRTLYVDSASGNDGNDGLSWATAWQTLANANRSVVAGDTVLLRGTFSGQYIWPNASGTAAAPIRFASDPDGAVAVLDGGGFGVAVWLAARDYIVVERLRIQSVAGHAVILDAGAHHNVVRDSVITDTVNAPWAIAVRISGSSDNQIERNEILNTGDEASNTGDGIVICMGSSRNRVLDNTLRNGGHGLIQIGICADDPGDAVAGDNVVGGNTLSNPYATPLFLSWMARRTLVERNRISDGAGNRVNYPRPGIHLNASENIVRYNEIFNNTGPGLMVSAYVFQRGVAQDAIGNQIYHNVVYANGSPGGMAADVGQSGVGLLISEWDGRTVRDNVIANNVFFRNTGFDDDGVPGGPIYSIVIDHYWAPAAWREGSLNGNQIRNNIVLREPGSPSSAGEPAILRIRNDASCASPPCNLTYSLTGFQGVYPEAANNLEADPIFTDEANRVFALQAGSPAIDTGMIIPRVDFRGAAPDIGLFEVAP